MPKGIFNPFVEKKPKKDFQASTDHKKPFDTEFGTPLPGNIKLDGDSHVLELQQIELEDIAIRLGTLVKDLTRKHRSVLLRHGIDLIQEGSRPLEPGEVSLPTPEGHLCVFIADESAHDDPKRNAKTEVEVFRRLARAFQEVPREILAKHKARVIVRA